jgi:hypothetical protein
MQPSLTSSGNRFAQRSGVRALLAALALGPMAAGAEDAPNLLTNPFYVALGTYIVETDTDVTLNGSSGEGTRVDWENTFGSGEVTRFRLDGQWRFADRHKARFMWFDSSRDNSRTLEEEIDWGDETFPVSARTRAEFSFAVYELAYEYAFLRRDNYEVSASFGLHYTELELTLSAKAETSGGALEADIKESGDVGAPLPVIGLRGLWALPYDLWIDAQAQYFALSIDEYDGSLTDLRLMLNWQPKTWLGIGIGYNQFSVDVDVEKNSFDGSLDWTYEGPMLFYSASF